MYVPSFNLTVSFDFIFSRHVFYPRAALLLWAFERGKGPGNKRRRRMRKND